MKKKLLLIIPIVFIIVLVGLVIYWNPPTTALSFKFDAVKIDENCTERGNFTIELSGDMIKPYFEDPRLDLTMVPFDGMQSLDTSDSSSTFEGTRIEKHPSGAFLMIDCSTWDRAANHPRFIRISFSPDFDRWVYHDMEDDMYYVGSVSGNHTVQELYEYFKPLITGSWPA